MTSHAHRRRNRIARGYDELVAEASAAVRTYSPEEAIDRFDDDGVRFVDVRDALELAEGTIRGAIHASRGRLEAHIDPESPHYRAEFEDAEELVFYCASGGRSALAALRAQELGLERVAHLDGGFTAWIDAGGPTEVVDVVAAESNRA